MGDSKYTGYASSILVTRSDLTSNDAKSRNANPRRVHITTLVHSVLIPLLAFTALLAWGGTQPPADTSTHSTSWSQEQIDSWVAEIVDPQLAALGCDTTPRLSDEVAVRPAGSNRDGVFDTAVVSKVPFDVAWSKAEAGTVYVVGWCD